ncbi:MAG TPA: hypothetical protein PLF31_02570 [Candidatus Paceibacterota bacterium]|nr:hypothetical protein [Candidatus Paceibacterota bacterium]
MTFNSTHKKILLVIAAVFFVAGVGFAVSSVIEQNYPKHTQNEEPQALPDNGPISVKGIITCLPHRESAGEQTLECAFGLQDYGGRFYALRDTDPTYKNITAFPGEAPVLVSGTFTAETHEKYQGIGRIDVTSVELADVPKRTTLTGTYMCLPHTNTTGPQTEECVFGLKADDGTYYAVDFYLMSSMVPSIKSGDRITASGVLTLIEMLSTDRWQIYPIKGIFSITDSFKKL